MKHQVAFYKLWKFHSNRFKPERIPACYLRKFGQILICEKKATEGFAANAGLFVCLSHSFWQSKQNPFSMFTLTNHTWAGKLRSRWHAKDNINNNVAICCTFNILVHKKTYSNLGFSNFNLWRQLKKKKRKTQEHITKEFYFKEGQMGGICGGEDARRRNTTGCTDDVVSLRLMKWIHEIHWVGFTLLKDGKLALWKIIARIGTLSSFKTSSALFNFLFAETGAWRFWLCGFLEILLLSWGHCCSCLNHEPRSDSAVYF